MAISEQEYFNMINSNNNSNKPVYNYNRDDQGKIEINSEKSNITTIKEINNNIIVNSLDKKYEMINAMIKEYYDNLTRTQIEIDILKKMYDSYDKNVFLKQIESLKNKKIEYMNKIRILNELKEE